MLRSCIFFLCVGCLLGQSGPGYTSAEEYENVELSFEYKLAQWAEAAVVLRAPTAGRQLNSGVAVFLAHDFHKKLGMHVTGAVAGIAPPLRLLPPSFGVWHKVELRLDDDLLEMKHDGELLQRTNLAAHKLGKGFIHLADLQHKYEVRGWKLRSLPERERYVSLSGPLQLRGAGEWSLSGDTIRGANGHGINYAAPVLKDFLFSAEVKAMNHANGGVFFRGSADEKKDRGFEVQIYSPLDSVFPTGSIYGLARSSVAADTEERWFFLQVMVEGRKCRVWVDGVQVAETAELPAALLEGQVGFQIHMENTSVEWRRPRARVLNLR
jgi:hypothetical protein